MSYYCHKNKVETDKSETETWHEFVIPTVQREHAVAVMSPMHK